MVPMETPVPPRTFLHGARMSWAQAPAGGHGLGSRPGSGAGWRTRSDRTGGMSTGIACVVTGDDARSLFVKAVNGSENPFALQLLTREARAVGPVAGPPRGASRARRRRGPGRRRRLVGDDHPRRAPGHRRPAPLDPRAELARVLRAWDPVAGRRRPARPRPGRATSRPPPFFTAWSALAADHANPRQPLVTSWLDPGGAADRDRSGGTTHDPPVLSHLDLRADNIALSDARADQDVWFVDWAVPRDWPPAGWTWPCCWP